MGRIIDCMSRAIAIYRGSRKLMFRARINNCGLPLIACDAFLRVYNAGRHASIFLYRTALLRPILPNCTFPRRFSAYNSLSSSSLVSFLFLCNFKRTAEKGKTHASLILIKVSRRGRHRAARSDVIYQIASRSRAFVL